MKNLPFERKGIPSTLFTLEYESGDLKFEIEEKEKNNAACKDTSPKKKRDIKSENKVNEDMKQPLTNIKAIKRQSPFEFSEGNRQLIQKKFKKHLSNQVLLNRILSIIEDKSKNEQNNNFVRIDIASKLITRKLFDIIKAYLKDHIHKSFPTDVLSKTLKVKKFLSLLINNNRAKIKSFNLMEDNVIFNVILYNCCTPWTQKYLEMVSLFLYGIFGFEAMKRLSEEIDKENDKNRAIIAKLGPIIEYINTLKQNIKDSEEIKDTEGKEGKQGKKDEQGKKKEQNEIKLNTIGERKRLLSNDLLQGAEEILKNWKYQKKFIKLMWKWKEKQQKKP